MKHSMSVLLLSLGLATAVPAFAADLTGTFEGELTCKDLVDGLSGDAPTTIKRRITMWVIDSGTSLEVETYGLLSGVYRGAAIDNPQDPDRAQVALIACGSGNVVSHAGLFRARTDGTEATIKGSSLVISINGRVMACKYSMKRTLTETPTVDPCS